MPLLIKGQSFPFWLKKRVIDNPEYRMTKDVISTLRLNTICQQALCPNIYDCFSQKRATFLILGERCTRSCRFCAIPTTLPTTPPRWDKLSHLGGVKRDVTYEEPDSEEPIRIKMAADELGLRHVIITSVTRDDLEDGGATHFVNCIKALKSLTGIIIEVLVPDFKCDSESIKKVLDAEPDIFSHNIETVPKLYPEVRPQADYERSLSVLKKARFFNNSIILKSGIMVGLGEEPNEVIEVMEDLREAGCDIITIGQYLRSKESNIEVFEFIEPNQFDKYAEIAKQLGFMQVFSGPFVRSSYLVNG